MFPQVSFKKHFTIVKIVRCVYMEKTLTRGDISIKLLCKVIISLVLNQNRNMLSAK